MDTREYFKFRKCGMTARQAFDAAKVEAEWRALWFAGHVSLIAEADTEPYDPGDCEPTEAEWDRINQLGVWGVIGRYSVAELEADDSDGWEIGDSIWGCAGYSNVLDPCENWYVTDIKSETIGRYKDAHEQAYSCYTVLHPIAA